GVATTGPVTGVTTGLVTTTFGGCLETLNGLNAAIFAFVTFNAAANGLLDAQALPAQSVATATKTTVFLFICFPRSIERPTHEILIFRPLMSTQKQAEQMTWANPTA